MRFSSATRPTPERRMETETELDRGGPSRIGVGIDGRHDRVHMLVGVVIHTSKRRQIDGVRSREPGGVERCRRMVDGDHRSTQR
jgi:hypothetical protein